MNIYEKIQKCRVELQKKKLKKSGENKFAKFKYYELGDFIPDVNILFYENKLFSNFSIQNGMATLRIQDAEDESSCEEFTTDTASADVKGCTPIQSLGAEHTYLKRYLYLNALEIVENDTLDPTLGSPDFEPEELPDNDLDIIAGLDAFSTVKEISNYFNEYNSKVKNKSQFIKAVNAKRKAISGGAQ